MQAQQAVSEVINSLSTEYVGRLCHSVADKSTIETRHATWLGWAMRCEEFDESEKQMSAAKKNSPAEGVVEFIGAVVFLAIVIGAIATACS